ncbi:Serine/threonine-protein kinase Nek9 [Mortierella sp. GBA39]|nr:Serine/threonine-protein kinase Nek9 [Mortierella sp. GBA39]
MPKYYDRKVQYKFLDTLGTGTYAAVYKVERLREGGLFAIKTMSLDRLNKFQNEAITLRKFPHTNVIAYISHFRYKDLLHLVLELASHSLHDAIVHRCIDKTTFLEYTVMMAAGVAHLHRHGILHGDIKPANILITKQNVVKTPEGIVGSENFQAPEAMTGVGYGLPADIFAFGRTLQAMMSNTRMAKNEAFRSFTVPSVQHGPSRRPTTDSILNEQFSALRVEELLEEDEMKEENENENEKKEENEEERKEEEGKEENEEEKEDKKEEEEDERKY